MPSKSKAQQRFMGMVHALNKGEMNPSDASPEVKKVAKSMKKKDAKDFASTKHKGKPNKVKQEWLKEMIKELVAQELNLEGTCGYGEDGELGDEPAGPHLLKIKKESFSELEAERYDKKLKSAIKRIAKKDRKKGLLLMNFYKKHWVEFMIKSKQALGESILNEGEKEKIEKLLIKYGNTPEDAKQMVSKTYDYIKKAYRNANAAKKAEIMSGLMKFETTEHIVKLVEKCWKGYEKKGTKMMFGKRYPNCVKKENINAKVIMSEMDYRGFVKYMNDFYGPKGIYPDKKKRTLKMKDIGLAYSVLLKKKPDFEIGYDSTDREMLRDILIKMRKLDPDYTKKEYMNTMAKKRKRKGLAPLEGFASAAQRRAAFASGYKAKGKKKKKEVVEAVKVLKFTKVKDNTLEKHLKFISKKVGAKLSKIDGGFRVDADGDIKKLTSVVDYVFDKSIKKGLMKGGGMSQINLVKEAMDKRQAGETLKQLGGNRFIMMTGAKHFGVGPNGMSFKIGKNSKRVNHVTIDYDRGRDLYNMKFDWVTIKGIKTKKKLKGIYADQLQDMFTRYTGMYTSL